MSFRGKKNIYVCKTCTGQIVTVDTDYGVTPFLLRCRATPDCKGTMSSSFYQVPQEIEPEYEWYKPAFDELAELSPETRSHVSRGGLLIRKIARIEKAS